jgi:glycosyltransferase involved in cell wall biosynthesis
MKQKLKSKKEYLVFVFFNLGIGGVQRKIVDICEYINRQRIYKDVDIHIILRDKTKFNLLKQVNYDNVYIHFRPSWLNGRIRVIFPVFIIWKMFTIKPKSVLSFLVMSSVYSLISAKLLFWLNIHVVINEDTYTSIKLESRLKKWFLKIFYPQANMIISPTQAAKTDLINKFAIKANKIIVIPNWTGLNQIPKLITPKYDLMFAGRFTKQKNLMYLLKAVKKIKKDFPKIKTILVGEGEDEEKIRKYILENKLTSNIKIIPTSHQISKLLLSSQIFTLTSEYEGMSVVLLEAMALKTPIIVSNFPGVNEYLIPKKTGYIESGLKNYTKRIISLLKSKKDRDRISNNAYIYVKMHHSPAIIGKYLSLLLKN